MEEFMKVAEISAKVIGGIVCIGGGLLIMLGQHRKLFGKLARRQR